MSELPELPPSVRVERPVPADGLERAVAAGRRRRARFLGGTAGGAALTVVLLGALLATPTTQRDSLQVASPEPTPVSSPEPAPEPAPSSTAGTDGDPSPEPQGAGSPQARPSGSAEGGESQPTAGPQEPEATPGAVRPPPPDQRPAYREMTDEDAAGHEFCTPTKVASGSCAYATDNGPVVRRGTPVTASSGYCSGPDGSGELVYEFRGGQETELVVLQGTREVFRFSSTVRYVDGAHERRLRSGRCLEFRQQWRGVDTAGSPVPAGEYRVVLTVNPSGVRYDFEDGTSLRQEAQANGHEFTVTLVD